LEENGLSDVILVVEKKHIKPKPSTELELVILQLEEESANVLKLLKDKIRKDFIVMNGDTMCEINLGPYLD